MTPTKHWQRDDEGLGQGLPVRRDPLESGWRGNGVNRPTARKRADGPCGALLGRIDEEDGRCRREFLDFDGKNGS